MPARRPPGSPRPSLLERTAYHEAGHAVAAVDLRRRVLLVSIVPADDRLGFCRYDRPPAWLDALEARAPTAHEQRWVERAVIGALAGSQAEALLAGWCDHRGAREDYDAAFDLAFLVCPGVSVVGPYLAYLRAVARARVAARWGAVKALARVLLAEKTVSGGRARQVVLAAAPDLHPSLLAG